MEDSLKRSGICENNDLNYYTRPKVMVVEVKCHILLNQSSGESGTMPDPIVIPD